MSGCFLLALNVFCCVSEPGFVSFRRIKESQLSASINQKLVESGEREKYVYKSLFALFGKCTVLTHNDEQRMLSHIFDHLAL